jgi:hypothetical protein
MGRRKLLLPAAGFALAIAMTMARPLIAASVTIGAGETYTLSAGDLVLGDADTLDANGTVASPCVIAGNGHAIVSHHLTGHVKLQNCVLQGLGGTQEGVSFRQCGRAISHGQRVRDPHALPRSLHAGHR